MTKQNHKKKSKKQKRLLTMSLILSLVIIIGSTFAWFTSKDEVTNHLTADGKFGVEITETFTPPTNWGKGQEINKDVNLLNTGNTDALARVQLSSRATLEKIYADTTAIGTSTTVSTDNVTLTEAEAIAHQAGGKCVVKAGTALTTPEAVESATLPTTDGLYIFERTDDSSTTSDLGQYAGYYKLGNNYYDIVNININKATDGTTSTTTTTYTAYLAKKQTLSGDSAPKFTWDYSKITSDNKITLTYDGGTSGTSATADDIIITINLANKTEDNKNIWSNSYQFIGDSNGYFYCTEVLGSGKKASNDLVDSITLTQFPDTYNNLQFDLDVVAEAVQAIDENGKVSLEAATSEWAYNNDTTSGNYDPYGVGSASEAKKNNDTYTITWSQQTATTGN